MIHHVVDIANNRNKTGQWLVSNGHQSVSCLFSGINQLRYLVTLCISLFAISGLCAREAYVVLDDSVMTFYYDELRDTRQASTYLVDQLKYGLTKEEREVINHAVFSPSFAEARPTSTCSWFENLTHLQRIDGMENLNTSEVNDMSYMFATCRSLTELDLSNFTLSSDCYFQLLPHQHPSVDGWDDFARHDRGLEESQHLPSRGHDRDV